MPLASILLPPSCLQNTVSKPAPRTQSQLKEKAEHNQIHQLEINEAVEEWKKTTLTMAANLSERFGKKPRHFPDLFIQNGAHLVHKHSKVNAYNAFLHMKAEELCDNSETPTLAMLHSEEFKNKYNNLEVHESEEIIACHMESSSAASIKCATAKGHVQDVASTFKAMQQMMNGLNTCVGVKGFICIVRNLPEYHMEPKWYFSNKAFMDYMKIAVPTQKGWDLGYVGTKLEAFAIAINLHRTSKQQADEIKRQIREKIHVMLVEITHNESAQMHYVDYEEKIIQRFGVELIGWTHEKFVNPSKLPTSLPSLQNLLDTINTRSCKFVQLTPAQLIACRQECRAAIENGSVPAPKTRNPRKDRGTKRKHVDDLDKENGDSGNAPPMTKKKRTSAAKKKVLGVQVQPKSMEIVDSEDSGKD